MEPLILPHFQEGKPHFEVRQCCRVKCTGSAAGTLHSSASSPLVGTVGQLQAEFSPCLPNPFTLLVLGTEPTEH